MLKRISSEQERNNKKKRNHILIGIILIGLMIISTAGYAFLQEKEDSTKIKYKGYQLVKINNYWQIQIEKQVYNFQYSPIELENVSISGYYDLTNYINKPLYFINNNYASGTILTNLQRYLLRYQEACLVENSSLNQTCASSLPPKTCNDNLIVYKDGNETKVWQNKNCVYLSGDLEKASETFVYKTLGVM